MGAPGHQEATPKKSKTGLVIGGGVLGLLAVMIIALAVTASSTKTSTVATTTTTTDPSQSPAAVAATTYSADFNILNLAVNAQIPIENAVGSDPVAAAGAFKAEITYRTEFDKGVRAIAFPAAVQAAVQQLLAADAALEAVQGTLSVNTDNIDNYNAVFDTVTPAHAAFAAANTTLGNALGLTTGN